MAVISRQLMRFADGCNHNPLISYSYFRNQAFDLLHVDKPIEHVR